METIRHNRADDTEGSPEESSENPEIIETEDREERKRKFQLSGRKVLSVVKNMFNRTPKKTEREQQEEETIEQQTQTGLGSVDEEGTPIYNLKKTLDDIWSTADWKKAQEEAKEKQKLEKQRKKAEEAQKRATQKRYEHFVKYSRKKAGDWAPFSKIGSYEDDARWMQQDMDSQREDAITPLSWYGRSSENQETSPDDATPNPEGDTPPEVPPRAPDDTTPSPEGDTPPETEADESELTPRDWGPRLEKLRAQVDSSNLEPEDKKFLHDLIDVYRKYFSALENKPDLYDATKNPTSPEDDLSYLENILSSLIAKERLTSDEKTAIRKLASSVYRPILKKSPEKSSADSRNDSSEGENIPDEEGIDKTNSEPRNVSPDFLKARLSALDRKIRDLELQSEDDQLLLHKLVTACSATITTAQNSPHLSQQFKKRWLDNAEEKIFKLETDIFPQAKRQKKLDRNTKANISMTIKKLEELNHFSSITPKENIPYEEQLRGMITDTHEEDEEEEITKKPTSY